MFFSDAPHSRSQDDHSNYSFGHGTYIQLPRKDSAPWSSHNRPSRGTPPPLLESLALHILEDIPEENAYTHNLYDAVKMNEHHI